MHVIPVSVKNPPGAANYSSDHSFHFGRLNSLGSPFVCSLHAHI